MKQAKKKPAIPAKSGKPKKREPQTAQQTIPYKEMFRDGICKVREGFYTKTIAYEDINYSVASTDDQATIFDGYCAFLNYFDSALPFQLSFINHRSRPENRYNVNIPPQDDDFNAELSTEQNCNMIDGIPNNTALPVPPPVPVPCNRRSIIDRDRR